MRKFLDWWLGPADLKAYALCAVLMGLALCGIIAMIAYAVPASCH